MIFFAWLWIAVFVDATKESLNLLDQFNVKSYVDQIHPSVKTEQPNYSNLLREIEHKNDKWYERTKLQQPESHIKFAKRKYNHKDNNKPKENHHGIRTNALKLKRNKNNFKNVGINHEKQVRINHEKQKDRSSLLQKVPQSQSHLKRKHSKNFTKEKLKRNRSHKRNKNAIHPNIRNESVLKNNSPPRTKRFHAYPVFSFRRSQPPPFRSAFIRHPPDWFRSIHHHHEQVAKSMRRTLHDYFEKTRRKWVTNINPLNQIPNSFSPIIPITFPTLTHPSDRNVPLFNEIFNSQFSPTSKPLSESHPNNFNFNSNKWHRRTPSTTPATTIRSEHHNNRGKTQFKVNIGENPDDRSQEIPLITVTENPFLYNRGVESNPKNGNPLPNSNEWINDKGRGEKDWRESLLPNDNTPNFSTTQSPKDASTTIQLPPVFEGERGFTDPEGKWDSVETKVEVEKKEVLKSKNCRNFSGLRKPRLTINSKVDETDWECVSPKNEIVPESAEEEVENEIEPRSKGKDGTPTFEYDIESCLQCPPKRKVVATRGEDCVPLLIPTPRDVCHTRGVLRYHIEVGPGDPKPGSLLKEGHYNINISILGGKEGKTPLKICTYEYDVQVHKCPPLPLVSGSQIKCSAGQAWGSHCVWGCNEGRKLVGSSSTVCRGHKRTPSWSHNPPVCEEIATGCPIPNGVAGGSMLCTFPNEIGSQVKQRPNSLYPKGTVCRIHCNLNQLKTLSADVLPPSKCSPTGEWIPKINSCHRQMIIPPKPAQGECKDINVQLPTPGIVHLINPRFLTVDGDFAHVWCDSDSVRSEGRFCRTCEAIDKKHGTTSSCRQCINVTGKLGCPSIQSPANGKLECHNTADGDLFCKVFCKEGYLLPPHISAGEVRCPKGMSLWDYQVFRNQRLPSCILR